MTPKGMTARPAFASIAGMMVCIGRRFGRTAFGWPGSSEKPSPRLCSITPDFGARIALPKDLKSELMKEHALPSRSTTER